MQRFFLGDLVYVADDLGISMDHFPKGQKAIVLHSYSEQYGRKSADDDNQFSLYLLKERSETSWYYANQLTLIEEDRMDLLPKRNEHRRAYDAKLARKQQMENDNG